MSLISFLPFLTIFHVSLSSVMIIIESIFQFLVFFLLYNLVLVTLFWFPSCDSTSCCWCSILDNPSCVGVTGCISSTQSRLTWKWIDYVHVRFLLLYEFFLVIHELSLEAWVWIDNTTFTFHEWKSLEHIVTVFLHDISNHTRCASWLSCIATIETRT